MPAVLIGTPRAEQLNPGLSCYLHVSDQESLQDRITQFASHIAVQYVLDSLYGCMFALDWERGSAFLSRSLPHTALPALQSPQLSPAETPESCESHEIAKGPTTDILAGPHAPRVTPPCRARFEAEPPTRKLPALPRQGR